MKTQTKKITTLKKAIEMLENGFKYNWADSSSCNCGVVLQAAGVKPAEISKDGSFQTRINLAGDIKCTVTGLRFSVIQKAFLEIGFTRHEILDLELLGNRYGNKFDVKENLLEYLRAWVSILEESEPKETPTIEVKERIVYVSIAETITKPGKELITANN